MLATVTLEYNNNNAIFSGFLKTVTKMPDVRIVRESVPGKAKKMAVKEFSRLSLSEQAKVLSQSMNKNVPPMTMEEIVQEVRDYRNGK